MALLFACHFETADLGEQNIRDLVWCIEESGMPVRGCRIMAENAVAATQNMGNSCVVEAVESYINRRTTEQELRAALDGC